jgi:hypothetical protein
MPTKSAWNCESNYHDPANRVIKNRMERYQRRSEYVREDGQHRMKTIIEKKICAKCARIEIEMRLAHNHDQTEAMF